MHSVGRVVVEEMEKKTQSDAVALEQADFALLPIAPPPRSLL